MLDRPELERVDPRPATDEELTTVHAPAHVKAVRRRKRRPMLAGEP